MVVDVRGYNLGFDPSPITNSVSGLVQQTILDRLGQKATAGDAEALSKLATRDPRAAQAIGGILMGREEQQLKQQEAQQKALQERQKISYAIARGYKSATNKPGFLSAAARQLEQLGQPEMAQDLLRRAELYATDPGALDQEADAIIGMNAAPETPITAYQKETLEIDRQKAENEGKKWDAELGLRRENLDLERARLDEMRANNASDREIKQQKLRIDQQEVDLKKAAATGSKGATEDERKAAGWLAQAQNSYRNMEKVLAQDPGSDSPGVIESLPGVATGLKNLSMSDARQKYKQAASSFAEAALRAATGAGVNKDEAEQKITELTPRWGDSQAVKDQKRESLRVYLGSLKDRAGRAAPDAPAVPEIPVAGVREGATATNPQTGQKIIFRNGKWQAM